MPERKHQKPATLHEARVAAARRMMLGTGGLALLATTVALAATGHNTQPRRTTADQPKPRVTHAQPPRPKPERPAPKVTPQEYLESAKRNDAIKAAATNAGARIVAAAKNGKIGPFDFYNFKTEQWGRTGNPGWGALQHNPEYGGSPNQIAAFVYQDKDGKIDLSRGVQDVMVRIIDGKHPLVELRSPLEPAIEAGIAQVPRGWTASVASAQMAGYRETADPSNNADYDTSHLRSIDHQAVTQVSQQLDELGI